MTSKKSMLVTSLQLSTNESYQENLDRLLKLIDECHESELIIAPEVCLTGFDYDNFEQAALFGQKALQILQEKINKQIFVITLILKEADAYLNQAVVIHRHKIIHRQNKFKLFQLGNETSYFKAGDIEEIVPFEIDGIKYALLICFELRFKELWKMIEGADIVLIPSRWGLPRKTHLEILSKALAVMNQCFVILSNSSDTDMASSSAIISPNGESISDDTKEILASNVYFLEIKKMRRYIIMK